MQSPNIHILLFRSVLFCVYRERRGIQFNQFLYSLSLGQIYALTVVLFVIFLFVYSAYFEYHGNVDGADRPYPNYPILFVSEFACV